MNQKQSELETAALAAFCETTENAKMELITADSENNTCSSYDLLFTINHLPAKCRLSLNKKMEEISEITGAEVAVEGRYIAPGEESADLPLNIHIKSSSNGSTVFAIQMIENCVTSAVEDYESISQEENSPAAMVESRTRRQWKRLPRGELRRKRIAEALERGEEPLSKHAKRLVWCLKNPEWKVKTDHYYRKVKKPLFYDTLTNCIETLKACGITEDSYKSLPLDVKMKVKREARRDLQSSSSSSRKYRSRSSSSSSSRKNRSRSSSSSSSRKYRSRSSSSSSSRKYRSRSSSSSSSRKYRSRSSSSSSSREYRSRSSRKSRSK